jgi:ssDNA thymidine ADP-ribosyltransferase, DarT
MTSVPSNPKIYHITHIDNLPNIIASAGLVSDANRITNALNCSLVGRANTNSINWAFSDRNAGSYLVLFYKDISALNKIDWVAVHSRDFRDAKVKEGKQAEFLTFDVFPWILIEKIGIINSTMELKVQATLANAGHQPVIAVERSWYF